MHGGDLRVAGGVAEEHAAGEGVRLHIGKPGVEGTGDALLGGVVAAEVPAPDPLEAGEVALQQLPYRACLDSKWS